MWAFLSNFDLCSSTGTFSRHLIPSGRGHQCSFRAVRDGRLQRPALSPRPVQQFDFRQAFANHGGEEKGKENAADQHVVVVVLEHVELLRGVDPGLVDVQTVSHNLRRKTCYWPCVDSALKIKNKIQPYSWKKKQNKILSLTRQVDSNPEGAVWIPRTLDTVWL